MTELTRIPEYNDTAVALADLKTRYDAVVFDVTTGKGMTAAKEARAELRGYRIALEAKRKEIKEPALTRCREIDSEAKRITIELEALEDPIDDLIKAEEQRKEREKAAREQAERERLDRQSAWFDGVKAVPLAAMGKTVAEIEALEADLAKLDPDALDLIAADSKAAAKFTIRNSIMQLRAARDARQLDDDRQAQIDRDLAELAKRREQDEADRIAREEVAAEQQRQAQAAADAREREERAAREAEAARERAEREAAEQAERDRVAEERRQLEAERAELARQEAARQQEIAEQERQRRDQQAREDAEREAERQQLARDQEELARRRVAKKIASSTLIEAATEALALLTREGYGESIEAQALASAIEREPKARKSA